MRLLFCCVTLFTCLSMLWSHPSTALTLDEVQANFAQYPVVQAKFTQKRSIKGMSRPLLSQGNLIMDQSRGIVWEQNKPFAMRTIITPEKMVQISANKVQTITKEQNPQLFNFTQILNAIFTSERQSLEQNFTYTFTATDPWQLKLVPKLAPLDKVFSSIEITGTQVILEVVLHDKQGDRTEISFSQHKLGTLATPEQIQQFE